MSACETEEVIHVCCGHQRYGHFSRSGKHECTGERCARARLHARISHPESTKGRFGRDFEDAESARMVVANKYLETVKSVTSTRWITKLIRRNLPR